MTATTESAPQTQAPVAGPPLEPIDLLYTSLRTWQERLETAVRHADSGPESLAATARMVARMGLVMDDAVRVGLYPAAWPYAGQQAILHDIHCPRCGTPEWDWHEENGIGRCDCGHRWNEPVPHTRGVEISDASQESVRARLARHYGLWSYGDRLRCAEPATLYRMWDAARSSQPPVELVEAIGESEARRLAGGIAARRVIELGHHAEQRALRVEKRQARLDYPFVFAYAEFYCISSDNIQRATVREAREDNAPRTACYSVAWSDIAGSASKVDSVLAGEKRGAVHIVRHEGRPVRVWYLDKSVDNASDRRSVRRIARKVAAGGHG